MIAHCSREQLIHSLSRRMKCDGRAVACEFAPPPGATQAAYRRIKYLCGMNGGCRTGGGALGALCGNPRHLQGDGPGRLMRRYQRQPSTEIGRYRLYRSGAAARRPSGTVRGPRGHANRCTDAGGRRASGPCCLLPHLVDSKLISEQQCSPRYPTDTVTYAASCSAHPRC